MRTGIPNLNASGFPFLVRDSRCLRKREEVGGKV